MGGRIKISRLKSDQSSQKWVVDMQTWQMQEAKAQISELVKRAQQLGPQEITLHGRSVAVVLSRETFDRLAGANQSLVEFMRQSPLYGLDELTFDRDTSPTREVAF